MAEERRLGITVLADYIVNEGIDGILDNLTERAGATAVAVNPIVTTEAEEGQGSWQPPSDAGASPRLFDRPLWGKLGVWVRSGPSYRPNEAHYRESVYRAKAPNDLTVSHGHLIGDFIDAALERGFKVYFQVPSVTPSGLREEDTPRLPNGEIPKRMANTGSLGSEDIRTFNRAFVRDLFETYPNVTGFRPDWPEYPCYMLGESFVDFGEPVKAWAGARGFDFEAIREEVGALWDYLHGSLRNADLEPFAEGDRGAWATSRLLRRHPLVYEWLRLKSALSNDLLRDWRETITAAGGAEKELSANAFMPPLTLFTGLDLAGASQYCQAISPKLYTMHWSVMVAFWGQELLDHNDGLDEALLVKALEHLFDIEHAEGEATRIADYGYPDPDVPHPIANGPQERRIRQAIAEADGKALVTPLMHGYGPHEDFARRFDLVAKSKADGVWINRYGYLSDAKLEAVGDMWRANAT